jgi:hypothetical protein
MGLECVWPRVGRGPAVGRRCDGRKSAVTAARLGVDGMKPSAGTNAATRKKVLI